MASDHDIIQGWMKKATRSAHSNLADLLGKNSTAYKTIMRAEYNSSPQRQVALFLDARERTKRILNRIIEEAKSTPKKVVEAPRKLGI